MYPKSDPVAYSIFICESPNNGLSLVYPNSALFSDKGLPFSDFAISGGKVMKTQDFCKIRNYRKSFPKLELPRVSA